MDNPRSAMANGDDNVGIPDDLRFKRSDGKQWRCTAMSMPDKTVCEKHYIQAKKRAANSALRASMKKAKRKSVGDESQVCLEIKSEDKDAALMDLDLQDYPVLGSGNMSKDRLMKGQVRYSPDSSPLKSMSVRNSLDLEDDVQMDGSPFDDGQQSYRASPAYNIESSKNMLHKGIENGNMATSEIYIYSVMIIVTVFLVLVGKEKTDTQDHFDPSTDSSDDTGGLTCHQCRRSDKGSVIWCLKCDRRGYCGSCISTWYTNLPLEEIQRVCPACRGCCNCKVCSRGDNLIKARIREIPVLDKLRYLYCLLSSVLPVVRQIHQQQCAEVELEKQLRGVEVDLERMKLNADEQMCCDCCRVPIVYYHRHCSSCSYDLCLSCCQDLRNSSLSGAEDSVGEDHTSEKGLLKDTLKKLQGSSNHRLPLSMKFPGWRANKDGSVPCRPSDHGGCGCPYLTLRRIFKMNWVAKLVKNLEEMVSGCKVNDSSSSPETGSLKSRFLECAYRKDSDDNLLYCPSAQEIKGDEVDYFRKHWAKGEPVIVKQVSDFSSSLSWDPMVIWREICETTDERMKDADRMVKAVDCLDWSEVDMELVQFMKGYSEGRIHENGWPQMLKLKDWPSPSAAEEFLLYQRPDFISKVPFLEFIHLKWGLLNVAAKLPHYSLQNDVGPKIFISYGLCEELGRGDSVSKLHLNMREMVYLLVHSCDVKLKGWQQANIEKIQKASGEPEVQPLPGDPHRGINEQNSLVSPIDRNDRGEVYKLDINLDEQIEEAECRNIDLECENTETDVHSCDNRPGAVWDVFRREDIPKLAEYLRAHWNEFGNSDAVLTSPATHLLYDEALYLYEHHKKRLKEEFGVEPWSFEQYLGQAVFVPAGCPFQVRNLQSTVQLGLDFLSSESLEQAVKLAEEIRCLPNNHAAKLQMVEVGKISLYAASSAIKEVQKLVLDEKLGAELAFEDRNLTAMVSENLERFMKQRQVACA